MEEGKSSKSSWRFSVHLKPMPLLPCLVLLSSLEVSLYLPQKQQKGPSWGSGGSKWSQLALEFPPRS